MIKEWLALIKVLDIAGKRIHDARLVAVMRVYAITTVLTFNLAHFASFPGITAISPRELSG